MLFFVSAGAEIKRAGSSSFIWDHLFQDTHFESSQTH